MAAMVRRRQRGSTLVETAVVLLLFFTLVFAIIEFGTAYNEYHAITNAAREGARYSVAPCSYNDAMCGTSATGQLVDKHAVENIVKSYLLSANIDPTGTNVNVSVQQGETATVNGVQVNYTHVHVEARYSFFFLPFEPVTLKSDAVMRNENN
jgi:Flp pilus assembly protein TadG